MKSIEKAIENENEDPNAVNIIYKNEINKIEKQKKMLTNLSSVLYMGYILCAVFSFMICVFCAATGAILLIPYIVFVALIGSAIYFFLIYFPGKLAISKYNMLLKNPEKIKNNNPGDYLFFMILFVCCGIGAVLLMILFN